MDYGRWCSSTPACSCLFAASFFHPRTGRDWRVMGGFTAFLVALFTEMYVRGAADRLPAVGLAGLEGTRSAGDPQRWALVERPDRLAR